MAGTIQQNAVDVAEYYRRRAPKQILAELDALSTPELLSHSERLVSRVIGPVLAAVNVDKSVLNDMDGVVGLLKALEQHAQLGEADFFSEELTHEEDTRDFESFDKLDEPPTEGTVPVPEERIVEVTDGAPPIKPVRTSEGMDAE